MPQRPYRRSLAPERLRQLLAETRRPSDIVPPEPEPGIVEKFAPTVIRGVGGLFGLNPVTGAVAGAGSELLAQGLEKDIDPRRILAAGAVGATGGAMARAIARFAGKPMQAALRGGLLGGAAPVAKSLIEEGELPEAQDVAFGGGVGAVASGGLAKLLGRFQPKAPAQPTATAEVIPTAQAGGQVLGTKKKTLIPAMTPTPIPIEKALVTAEPKLAAFADEVRPEVPPLVYEDPQQLAQELAEIGQRATTAGIRPTKLSAVKAAKDRLREAKEALAAAEAKGLKSGLTAKKKVTETATYPTETGVGKIATLFAKKGERKPSLRKTSEVSPEGTPQRDIYDEWIAAGRDPKTALRLAIAGRQRLVPPTAAPEAPQAGLSELLGVRAAEAIPEAPRAPVSTLETPVGPSLAPTQEIASAGVIGPREAIAAESLPAERALEEIQELTGGAGARAAAQAMPPAGVPEAPAELSVLKRLLAGETLPEGPRLPPTPKRAAAITRAQQTLSPEINAKLEELGRAYDMATDPVEKRAIGAMLQATTREAQAAAKGLSPAAAAQPLGPPGGPRQQRVPPPSKMTASTAQQGIADEAEKLFSQGVDPEEAIATAKQTFIDRLRRLGAEGRGGGETGAINPELLTRLGLGAAGATVGAITDPLGDPVLSATAGAGLGFSVPTLAKVAGQTLTRVRTDPTVPPKLKQVAEAIATGDQNKIAGAFWRDLPAYLRANMLVGPNTPSNFFAGPWGAGTMAGLELHMAGDQMGARILAQMTPANWAREYAKALPEARQLITNVAAMSQERFGVSVFNKILQFPAVGMMAGDIATRNVLKAAGMSEELARRYTLTSEPAIPLLRNIANIQRSGPIGQMLLPFARTVANIVEQSLIRTPLIGPMVQAKFPALAHPAAVQAQQQLLGTAVPLAAGAIGYATPEGDTFETRTLGAFLRGLTSNVAGPASGLASVGFGVGKALQRPEPKLGDVVASAGREALQTIPLPTTDVPTGYLSTLKQLLSGELPSRVPSGALPGASFINSRIQGNTGVTGRPRRPSRRRG